MAPNASLFSYVLTQISMSKPNATMHHTFTNFILAYLGLCLIVWKYVCCPDKIILINKISSIWTFYLAISCSDSTPLSKQCIFHTLLIPRIIQLYKITYQNIWFILPCMNNILTDDHALFYKYILAYLSDDEEKDRRKQRHLPTWRKYYPK